MPKSAPSPSAGDDAPALAADDLDALYDFALTVTWDPDTAFEAVVAALDDPYDPQDVPALFARVRQAALNAAPEPPEQVVDLSAELPPPDHPAGGSLEALALGVAAGLDPTERAALDLGLRHRFEGTDLAVVLDAGEEAAAEAVVGARDRADRLLGHYVLARVATDACPALREMLEDPPEALEPLAAIVDEHLAQCSMCTDRRHGIRPPSALLADLPPRPAPEELHAVVLPPPEDDDPWYRRVREPRVLRWTALVVAVVGAGVFLGFQLFSDSDSSGGPTTPRAGIRVDTETIDLAAEETSAAITIQNRTGGDLAYTVEVDVPYLTVEPAEGTLPRSDTVDLTFTLDRSAAPEGHSVTSVRVVSRAGTAEIDVAADVVRAPSIGDLAADPAEISPAPCEDGVTRTTLSAVVADDSGVASVVARWSGAALFDTEDETLGDSSGELELSAADGNTYEGTLGPFGESGTVTWSIEAADGGGNASTSEEAEFEVLSECVPLDEDA